MTGRLTPRSVARPLDVVVRRLRALSTLSESELELLRSLGERRERHLAGEELVSEGGLSGRPRFIISGWASRQRVLPDGRRQIFSFLLPGDGIGLGRRASSELSGIAALTALWGVVASLAGVLCRMRECNRFVKPATDLPLGRGLGCFEVHRTTMVDQPQFGVGP